MTEAAQKRFLIGAAVLLAGGLILKIGSTTILTFICGSVCTILVEVLVLMKYLSVGNSSDSFYFHQPTQPDGSEAVKIKAQISSSPLTDADLICACCTDSFQELLIGAETRLKVLQRFVKDAISMDKNYAQALSKLGETSLLNKIVRKQFMFKGEDSKNSASWMHIRETLHVLANKLEQDSEYLAQGVAGNLKAVSMSCSDRLKELSTQHKEASEAFIATTHELKDLQSKLASSRKAELEAERNYEAAKHDLASFSSLAKLEMHLKIARNTTSTLNSKLHEVRNRITATSSAYLPKMQLLNQEFRKVQYMRVDAVKGCLESWASVLEDNLTQSIEVWRELRALRCGSTPISNEGTPTSFTFKGFLQKALPKLGSENLADKIENDIKQITNFSEEIKGFLANFAKAECTKAANLKRLAAYEILMEDEGMQEGWDEFSVELMRLSEVSERFVGELETTSASYQSLDEEVDSLNRIRKSENPDFEELRSRLARAMATRDECSERIKAVVLRTYETRLIESKKTISGLDRNFDSTLLYKDTTDFTPLASDHRTECPCYRIETSELELRADEEAKICGGTETCRWFNDLLTTFFQEWGSSDKFQDYVCNRLNRVYNKKRPKYLSEITVKQVDIVEPAPELKDFTPLECGPGDFFYEFEVYFNGQVRIHLGFEIKWALGSLQVNAVVVLKSLYGRLRVFYTPCDRGRSFYAFTAEPAFQISIEPVLGKENKLVLSKYPKLTTFLVSILAKKIRKYVWPNRRSLKIPKSRRSTCSLVSLIIAPKWLKL